MQGRCHPSGKACGLPHNPGRPRPPRVGFRPPARAGAILFTVIIVLFFLSVFASSVAAFAVSRHRWVRVEVERAQAFYLAEAAMALALHELKYGLDPAGDGLGTVSRRPFGEGTLHALHDSAQTVIRAEGTVEGVRRVIELKYEAF